MLVISLTAQWQARFQQRKIGVVVGWPEDEHRALSTGSLGLDTALETGGFPSGKLVEIYGKEATGKSTLALAAIAQCERSGRRAALLETEHKLTKSWARKTGVDLSRTLFLNCTDGLECLRALSELVSSGDFALVVVDSLAGLVWCPDLHGHGTPLGEAEKSLERCLALIAAEADRTKTTVLFLNQVRSDSTVVFGDNTVTFGGHVLRHSCSIRVELRREIAIKRRDEVIGFQTKAIVKKSSVGSSFKTASLTYTFERGLDEIYELIELARAQQVFDATSCQFKFDGQTLGKSQLEAYDYLLLHPKILDSIRQQLLQKMKCLSIEEECLTYAS